MSSTVARVRLAVSIVEHLGLRLLIRRATGLLKMCHGFCFDFICAELPGSPPFAGTKSVVFFAATHVSGQIISLDHANRNGALANNGRNERKRVI